MFKETHMLPQISDPCPSPVLFDVWLNSQNRIKISKNSFVEEMNTLLCISSLLEGDTSEHLIIK